MKKIWKKNIGIGKIRFGMRIENIETSFDFSESERPDDECIWYKSDSQKIMVMTRNDQITVICCDSEFIISDKNIVGMEVSEAIETIGSDNYRVTTDWMVADSNYEFPDLGIDFDVVDEHVLGVNMIWDQDEF